METKTKNKNNKRAAKIGLGVASVGVLGLGGYKAYKKLKPLKSITRNEVISDEERLLRAKQVKKEINDKKLSNFNPSYLKRVSNTKRVRKRKAGLKRKKLLGVLHSRTSTFYNRRKAYNINGRNSSTRSNLVQARKSLDNTVQKIKDTKFKNSNNHIAVFSLKFN